MEILRFTCLRIFLDYKSVSLLMTMQMTNCMEKAWGIFSYSKKPQVRPQMLSGRFQITISEQSGISGECLGGLFKS